jgi:Bcr/CflA subfamily drug resistance transporter
MQPASSSQTTDDRGSIAPLILTVCVLTAAGPLAIDMYIPGLPAMGTSLGASSSRIQLTMTAFLAGLVVGQLVVGPISDGIGRRKLLLGGTLAFSVASLACAAAPSAELLIAFRMLQGLCGAVGIVLARAVLTDLFAGPRLPRVFALLSQILGAAPVVAPVLGGLVLAIAEWRWVFVCLAVFGVAQFVLVLTQLPESLPPERRHGGGLGPSLRSMRALLRHRSFVGYMLVLGATGAAVFGYVSGSSFVFQEIHGLSETQYSLLFASNACGLVIAGQIFARLSRRIRLNRILIMAITWVVFCNLTHVVLLLILGDVLAVTWACIFGTMLGIGMIFPTTMTIGQTIGRATPGAASALMGTLQFLCGAAASPLVGILGHATTLPMAMIMFTAFTLGAVALAVLARPWLAYGEVMPGD